MCQELRQLPYMSPLNIPDNPIRYCFNPYFADEVWEFM